MRESVEDFKRRGGAVKQCDTPRAATRPYGVKGYGAVQGRAKFNPRDNLWNTYDNRHGIKGWKD